MAFRDRQRRRRFRASIAVVLLLSGGAGSAWWLYREERASVGFDAAKLVAQSAQSVAPPTTHPVPPKEPLQEPVKSETNPEQVPEPVTPSAPTEKSPPVQTKPSPVQVGKEALGRDDLVAARTAFSEAIASEQDAAQQTFLRGELTRISGDTILSPRLAAGDPLVERYVIRSGDVLAKIATANKITPELLASVNGIANKNQIREGQSIKVIKGPFRAVVRKRAYRIEVYLGDVFVREFNVGLGADDGTPTGEWRVGTKLVNPTYYPPRGGGIVSADDPKNPLGERWIGLVGVGGVAVDQQRYGVHGTNEPDSIGKNLSMGCVRLRNEDVEILYDYLIETHSTVTVVE